MKDPLTEELKEAGEVLKKSLHRLYENLREGR